MKITSVDVYQYELTYVHGAYVMSHGRSQESEPSLVVRLGTDEGVVGWGETCPHGGTYLPAFHEGERAALALLGEAVLGLDPRQTGIVQAAMADTLIAGMAAKCAIDVACWDAFGKSTGLSVAALLGGRMNERIRVFEPVSLGSPEAMAEIARTRLAAGGLDFQLKVGDDPYEDAARVAAVLEVVGERSVVIADANGGWNLQNAIIAAREMAGMRIYLEQPCVSIGDVAEVRRRTDLPLIVDECVTTAADLFAAKAQASPGGLNIKPGRLGGLTPCRQLRDMAAGLAMQVTIDDTWGGALVTAALAQLACSTPPNALLSTSFFTEWTRPHLTEPPGRAEDGFGEPASGPGLGVEVDVERLGDPVIRLSCD